MTQIFRVNPWDPVPVRKEHKPKSRAAFRGRRLIPFEICQRLRQDVKNGETIFSAAKKYGIGYCYACMINAGDARVNK